MFGNAIYVSGKGGWQAIMAGHVTGFLSHPPPPLHPAPSAALLPPALPPASPCLLVFGMERNNGIMSMEDRWHGGIIMKKEDSRRDRDIKCMHNKSIIESLIMIRMYKMKKYIEYREERGDR